MNQLFKKIKRNITDYGLWITFTKSFSALFSHFYLKKIYRLYRIDLRNYVPKKVNEEMFTYRIINKNNYDQDKVRQIEELEEWSAGKIGPELQNDAICLVALDGERVAGFNWINLNSFEIPIIEKTMTFRPDKAWSQQITVNPDYRGKGLGSTLRYKIFEALQNMGIKKFYGGTLHNNYPNIKLSQKVGFEFFVDIHFTKIFGSKKWKYRRVK